MKKMRRGKSKKPLYLVLALILLAGILLFNLSSTLAEPGATGTDSISGSLWAQGIAVYLYGANDRTQALDTTETDADGAFCFEHLAPGEYVVGIALETTDDQEYLQAAANGSAFAIDESFEDPPMAFSDVIEITEDTASAPPQRAPAPAGNAYTINVNDYYGSLTVPGPGYSYNTTTNVLTFDTAANGNTYTITKTAAAAGSLTGIVFQPGSSPASVTMVGLMTLSKGITLPADFSADLAFKQYNGDDVDLKTTALTLPTGYKGNLDINGLKAAALNFPSDYDLPITFKRLEISTTLTYPTGYKGPIIISGPFVVPSAQQFPANYTGEIIIGDTGGTFTNSQTVCRPGAGIGFDAGIYLPNNLSTLTINNAKTGGSGHLNIKLGASDNFKLLLAGSSDINGYIEVPTNATLTIDSKASTPASPHSESGKLAITTSGANACIGTGANTIDSGQIIINGGTVEATQTNYAASAPAAIGGGSAHAGHVTINGGKVVATGNENGAAIGGGNGMYGVGYVTITGGDVIARCVPRDLINNHTNGAAIGGGNNATGGFSADGTLYGPYAPEVAGAHVLITGGTVLAESGDMERNHLGSSNSFGAAIGSGRLGHANVTITGGHVTANSGHGACIGNGAGNNNGNSTNHDILRGKVTITGDAVIRGYSLTGANIGAGHNCTHAPIYHIDKEADILMYSRGYWDGLFGVSGYRDGTGKDNRGDGYFVSMFLDPWCNEIIRGNVIAYNMTDPWAPVKYLPIQVEDNYMSVLFSTGKDYPEDFQIFVEFYDYYHVYQGLRQFVHYYDHLPPLPGGGPSALQKKDPIIPSVTHMNSYPHNFEGVYYHTLMVHLDYGSGAPVYYKVTERYSDTNGNPIRNDSGNKSKESFIRQGLTYSGPHEEITDYIYKGFKMGSPPSNSSDYTAGEPNVPNVSGDIVVYFVYEAKIYRYLVSKDSNPGVILSTHHWLQNAVNACGTDGPYTITATEDDTDVTNNAATAVLFPSTKTITLTSNVSAPWTITQPNAARHIKAEGSLTLKNIKLDGAKKGGGGVFVADSGTMTMNDGSTISGNIAGSSDIMPCAGGGVYVDGGSLTMNNGSTISGNIGNIGNHNGAGGGVYVHGGTLTMNTGSVISGNYASSGTTASGNFATGGGVYVTVGNKAGTFAMNGGTVSNNYAGYNSFGTGGGVYVVGNSNYKATFNMIDGTISDNIASRTSFGPAGGVNVTNYGIFNMSGGKITRNTVANNSTGQGGGVNISGTGAFNMSGTAEISYNTGSVNGTGKGGGVFVDNGTFTMKDTAVIKNNTASEKGTGNGGGIYLANGAQFTAANTAQITGNSAPNGDGGGIFSEGYDYSDPVDTSKYATIQNIANTVIFSGNTSDAKYKPPGNAALVTRFDGNLLNNSDINYHNPKGPIPNTTTLTITKTVAGDYGDKTKAFTFAVFFGKFDIHGEVIELTHGQSKTFDNLAVGSDICIVELVPGDYTASFEDSLFPGVTHEDESDTGWLLMTDTARTITFTNTRAMVPETNIDVGDTGAMLLLALVFAAAALTYLAAKGIYRRRRQGVH